MGEGKFLYCYGLVERHFQTSKHRLINKIVTCLEGPFFLRAIDCFGKRKYATFQFELL
jgi:hypothetical protein